jgi:hypothetical protein
VVDVVSFEQVLDQADLHLIDGVEHLLVYHEIVLHALIRRECDEINVEAGLAVLCNKTVCLAYVKVDLNSI